MVDKATSVWNRYHDTGRWKVEPTASGRMLGELRDFEVRDQRSARGCEAGCKARSSSREVKAPRSPRCAAPAAETITARLRSSGKSDTGRAAGPHIVL